VSNLQLILVSFFENIETSVGKYNKIVGNFLANIDGNPPSSLRKISGTLGNFL